MLLIMKKVVYEILKGGERRAKLPDFFNVL